MMNNYVKILVLVFFGLTIISCSLNTENLPKPNKLRVAIIENISIPFEEADTVIYQSFIGICGNSSREELNTHYNPKLNESPYANLMQKNYKGKIWFTGEELNENMNKICNGTKKSVFDCFSKDKINLSISGVMTSNNAVEIYEQYSLNDKFHTVSKTFSYRDGLWKCKINKVESRI